MTPEIWLTGLAILTQVPEGVWEPTRIEVTVPPGTALLCNASVIGTAWGELTVEPALLPFVAPYPSVVAPPGSAEESRVVTVTVAVPGGHPLGSLQGSIYLPQAFTRGDSNADGKVDISDGIYTLGCLFLGTSCPECSDATDANDDGRVDISDAIFGLAFLFLGGPEPEPPYAQGPGFDPTPDELRCGTGPTLVISVDVAYLVPETIEEFRPATLDRIGRYPATDQEVVLDELLLLFPFEVSPEEVLNTVAPVGGFFVGGDPALAIYQVRFPGSTVAAVEEFGQEIERRNPRCRTVLNFRDYGLEQVEAPNDPELRSHLSPYKLIAALPAWQVTTGLSTTTIAVVDAGFAPEHRDLQENVSSPEAVLRTSGWHGTHVAGIAGARGDNGIGIAGMCWSCRLQLLEWSYDETRAGICIHIIRKHFENGLALGRMRQAVDVGVDVINLSGGIVDDLCSSPQQLAAQQALWARPIEYAETEYPKKYGNLSKTVFVFAAGNLGIDAACTPPAGLSVRFPSRVITVAAVDERGEIATAPRSNFGSAVTVAAPGTHIQSTSWDPCPFCSRCYGYRTASGTSGAAPFVSGLIGLLRSMDSSMSAEDVVRRIKRGARQGGLQVRERRADGTEILHPFFVINALKTLQPKAEPGGPCEAGAEVVPYLASGYRYLVVPRGAGGEFQQPGYDDSTFATGDAGFGTPSGQCQLNATDVRTTWPTGTDILIRKEFELPADVCRLRVGVAIDNDVQVFINGRDISSGLRVHEQCATRDSFVFTANGSTLRPGTNLLAIRGRDREVVAYLDVQVSIAACGPAVNQFPPQGLVGWWRGEGNAEDSSENGRRGMWINGERYEPGVADLAFRFDGVDDMVEIPDHPSLRSTEVTIAAWVNFKSLDGRRFGGAVNFPGQVYLVFKRNSRTGDFSGYSIGKPGEGDAGWVIFGIDSAQGVHGGAMFVKPVVGQWYHVAGTYDGTTARAYLNGVLTHEQFLGYPIDHSTQPLVLGRTGQDGEQGEANWDGAFNGLLDEVMVFKRALCDAEVQAIYAAQRPTPLRYTITDLIGFASLEEEGSEARAINDEGQVAGVWQIPAPAQVQLGQPFLWEVGGIIDLCRAPTCCQRGRADAINNLGHVVGTARFSGDATHAFIWKDGCPADLGVPTGSHDSYALGINSVGEIVGLARDDRNSPPNPTKPMLWLQGGRVVGYLSLGGWANGGAWDINDAGDIAGSVWNAGGNYRAVMWDARVPPEDRVPFDLGTLGGSSLAVGINSTGQVVGWSYLASGATHAFLYRDGTMLDLGTLGGWWSSEAYDINDAGQVVGFAETVGGRAHAFLWQDGRMQDLNEELPAGSGWELVRSLPTFKPLGINNRGQIVGHGKHNGLIRAFLLTPVEE